MRIVFMGTPDIAKEALCEVLKTEHEVVAVYTRMDKPQGRKKIMTAPVVKQLALEKGITVMQPATMRKDPVKAAEELMQFKPDLCVVVAYGLILPPQVLAVPKYGCINMHVSLLPKYRGSAPIQWAVINGDEKTGVSIMQMDEGLDTGPVLAVEEVEISPTATAGEVFDNVSDVGAKLLVKTIAQIENGTATAKPQPTGESYAPPLDKKMAQVDFSVSAYELHNLIRGCNPWPLAFFMSNNKRIKIKSAMWQDENAGAEIGEIISCKPLTIACKKGAIILNEVVPEGAKAMSGEAFAAGRRFKIGDNIL